VRVFIEFKWHCAPCDSCCNVLECTVRCVTAAVNGGC